MLREWPSGRRLRLARGLRTAIGLDLGGLVVEAAQDAVVWTMFHYGIAGWSMYALLGMAMGYFAYRWGMPLSIRAALYPLLGKRVRGPKLRALRRGRPACARDRRSRTA